jgi:hypothetical protein
VSPGRLVAAERRRPSVEGRGRRPSAAATGSFPRVLQLDGDRLVASSRRLPPVPRLAVRIANQVGGGRQGGMDPLALGERRTVVDGRTYQGAPEADGRSDRDEPPCLCLPGGAAVEPQVFARLPEQGGVAAGIGRGGEQQGLGVAQEGLDLLEVAQLEAAADRERLGQRQVAGQLGWAQSSPDLDQGQGIAAGLLEPSFSCTAPSPTRQAGPASSGICSTTASQPR